MNNVVLNAVDELILEIKSSDNYKSLLILKELIDNSDDIKKLILSFNQAKEKFEEASKYGKHHPDLQKIQLELAAAKSSLFNNEEIVKYKKLEKEIQKELDNISKSIAQAVSPRIKFPNEIGLINKH